MSARYRSLHQSLVIAVVLMVLLAGVPAAWAQYTIPDCYVAAVNGMFPDEAYAAARDQLYKADSEKWNAEVAGLTPEQLAGYRAYFCAHLAIIDTGKDEDGTQHFAAIWPPVDVYLASIGQQSGASGGAANSGGSANGSGGASSGTSGASANSGKNVSAQPDEAAAPENLLFDSDFDALPTGFEIYDDENNPVDGTLVTQAGRTVLHVEADTMRSIYLTEDQSWTDYAIEARIKIRDGALMISTRMADDYCSSYDFYVEPASHYGSIQASDTNCDGTVLQDRSDLKLQPGQWANVRFESVGTQIKASINGNVVLTASDNAYTSGFPALTLFPDEDKTATFDIDTLRVIALKAAPDTLAEYGEAPAQAIAELQEFGQIPSSGGTLLFQQRSAYAAGNGLHFYAMAMRSPRTDVVMAATLNFTARGEESEYCALVSRISDGSGMVSVGFDNEGYVFFNEILGTDEDGQFVASSGPDYPPGQDYHLLVTLIGSQAAVYVDGVRALTVDDLSVHSGTHALVLVGSHGNSRCDARNFWAYSFK